MSRKSKISDSEKIVTVEKYLRGEDSINHLTEEAWLSMLSDRNLTSHVYKEEMAEEIVQRITGQYMKELEKLLSRLKTAT